MTNIILLATYWNEIEWIESSLEQILKIDPVEIIICDGNFDPRVLNGSTDGTREIIERFVDENSDRARMIDAVWANKLAKGMKFFAHAGRVDESIKPSRINYALRSQFIINEYRVNQSLTFAKMMNMSKKWASGVWVMSYDADQFYSDDLIDMFQITNESTNYGLITADEWTFPFDFRHYTTTYEMRKWNNMPHKIEKGFAVYPTRHFVKERLWTFSHVYESTKAFHAGAYHHYKFRDNVARLNAGYALGDRKPPDSSRYENLQEFSGQYPEPIRRRLA